jgi:uncharacterized protein (TIGR03032 family)
MTDAQTASFDLDASRHFAAWLAEIGGSLGFTTYQIGKVFLVGLQPNGRLSVYERTLDRCMGLAATANGFFISTAYQIWRFENVLPAGQLHNGYDALYVPQSSWVTDDIDSHDIGVGTDGRPVFANTLFSCLATVSETASFKALWTPPFIDRLAPEDCCHLNGLAMHDGVPHAVTSVSRSTVADGWRDRRVDGGCVIRVEDGEILATGLSMPHSPRFHAGRLWVHNSGTGEFGYLDPGDNRFQAVAFCPGYLRGLTFVGDYAVVGLSKPRHKTFSGLPLDNALSAHDAKPRCGLQVIDLKTGDQPHWLRCDSFISEIYDVAAFPTIRRPMLLGFKTDEIKTHISFEGSVTGNSTDRPSRL